MDKYIVVQWVESTQERPGPFGHWGYAHEMVVIKSTHPRFVVGSRFDYGFHGIAVTEGYAVAHLPVDASIRQARALLAAVEVA